MGRRGFLTVSGIAAASATGYFTGTAGASVSITSFGYGDESYGASGYGGAEATN